MLIFGCKFFHNHQMQPQRGETLVEKIRYGWFLAPAGRSVKKILCRKFDCFMDWWIMRHANGATNAAPLRGYDFRTSN